MSVLASAKLSSNNVLRIKKVFLTIPWQHLSIFDTVHDSFRRSVLLMRTHLQTTAFFEYDNTTWNYHYHTVDH